jgi:hypothetical protein
MRWMKHLTTARNDERLQEIRSQYGPEGYGLWWLICEIVAEQMDETDKCEVSYPMSAWAAKLQISKRKTTDFFRELSDIYLIFLEYDNSNCVGKIKIKIPKLLKYRDEYSKKLRTNSGVTPDKIRSKKEIEKEIENTDSKEPLKDGAVTDKPKRPPQANKLSDDEWMSQIKANPAYEGINIETLKGKMDAWCMTKGKKPTRARLLNWLNREEKPMAPSIKSNLDAIFTDLPAVDNRAIPGHCKTCGGGTKRMIDYWECKKCGHKTKERPE